MIVDESYKLIEAKYGGLINNLFVSDVRIGALLSAIRLSDGSCGVASTHFERSRPVEVKQRYFGPFSPGKIVGRKVSELFDQEYESEVVPILKVAALNAISPALVSRNSRFKVFEEIDPLELTEINSNSTVTMVGAFKGYINRIASVAKRLHVLEMNRDSLRGELQHLFVPAHKFADVIPSSEIVIITGLTLINKTLESILETVTPGTQVVLVGPSGNIYPELLFTKGVTIVGASRVVNPDLVFDLVSQAASGFHLYEQGLQKICIKVSK